MIFVIFILCYCQFYRFVNNMISAFHSFFLSGCQTIIMMVQLVRLCFILSGCEREALSNVRPLRIPCSDVRNSIKQKRACMFIWTKHAGLLEQSMHAFHFRSKVRSNHHRRRRCFRCCATPVLSSPSIPSFLFSSSCQVLSMTSLRFRKPIDGRMEKRVFTLGWTRLGSSGS